VKPFDLRAGPNGWSGATGVSRGRYQEGGEETYRYGEALRQRNTEERIIAGKPTTLRRPTIPLLFSLLPSFPAIPAKRKALLITRRNILRRALCNIANRGVPTDYSESIDDAKSQPHSRFATLHVV